MSDARSLSDIKHDLKDDLGQIMSRYPTNRSAIMPALDLAQQKYGEVDELTYQAVSELLEVPEIWVFEVASFYTLFDRTPKGRHHVRLCTNLSCMLRNSVSLLQYLQDRLEIGVGETTKDGAVTLSAVECLGACETAPMMMVDGQYYGDLTTAKLDEFLEQWSKPPTKEAS